MVSIFIGILSVETQISKIEKVMIFDGSGQITGEVESVIEYDYGTSIALKNIAIENDDDSINLTSKGKLYTTIRLDNSLQIGSVITFVGDVVSNSIFDTVDLNKIVNN